MTDPGHGPLSQALDRLRKGTTLFGLTFMPDRLGARIREEKFKLSDLLTYFVAAITLRYWGEFQFYDAVLESTGYAPSDAYEQRKAAWAWVKPYLPLVSNLIFVVWIGGLNLVLPPRYGHWLWQPVGLVATCLGTAHLLVGVAMLPIVLSDIPKQDLTGLVQGISTCAMLLAIGWMTTGLREFYDVKRPIIFLLLIISFVVSRFVLPMVPALLVIILEALGANLNNLL